MDTLWIHYGHTMDALWKHPEQNTNKSAIPMTIIEIADLDM